MVRRGQSVRVLEVEGGQIGDFVVFDAANLRDCFDQGRTKANQGRILITTGHVLYSKSNRVLMTITADTYGIHDLQYGMCSHWIFTSGRYRGFTEGFAPGGGQGRPEFGCWEILTEALKPWAIAPEDIPSPFNMFQTMRIDPVTGALGIEAGRSRARRLHRAPGRDGLSVRPVRLPLRGQGLPGPGLGVIRCRPNLRRSPCPPLVVAS